MTKKNGSSILLSKHQGQKTSRAWIGDQARNIAEWANYLKKARGGVCYSFSSRHFYQSGQCFDDGDASWFSIKFYKRSHVTRGVEVFGHDFQIKLTVAMLTETGLVGAVWVEEPHRSNYHAKIEHAAMVYRLKYIAPDVADEMAA